MKSEGCVIQGDDKEFPWTEGSSGHCSLISNACYERGECGSPMMQWQRGQY